MSHAHLVAVICCLWSYPLTDSQFVNVAIRQPAWQSSTFSPYNASKAVDGNNDTYFTNGSCSQTNNDISPPSWWAVDLGDVMEIHHVVVTGRDGAAAVRLEDFNVGVTNTSVTDTEPVPGHYAECAYVEDYVGPPNYSVNKSCRAFTRYLVVQFVASRKEYMMLCEVEVFADIDECKGSPCNQQCENYIGGYRCSCDDGYSSPDPNNIDCEDIDECSDKSLNTCDQQCINTPGSYKCACYNGFDSTNPGKEPCEEMCGTVICDVKTEFCDKKNQTNHKCSCQPDFHRLSDQQQCTVIISDGFSTLHIVIIILCLVVGALLITVAILIVQKKTTYWNQTERESLYQPAFYKLRDL